MKVNKEKVKHKKHYKKRKINEKNELNDESILNNINISEQNELKQNDSKEEKETNQSTTNQKRKFKKKNKIFLGKKRKLIYYKRHSLQYNEYYKSTKGEEKINFDINNLSTITFLNQNLIKGRFVGLLQNEKNDNDIIIETNNVDNPNYCRYIVYDTKTFKQKLSFIENVNGTLNLLYENYAAFVSDDNIKIYYFSKNNTNYDIFQKIILPDELKNSVLFLFKFIYEDNFYFFNKIFNLSKDNKLLIYKYNKEEKENENDFSIKGRTFVEDFILTLDFEFIWFSQKNNNELVFFYELEFNFKFTIFDLSKMKIIEQKIIKLNDLKYIKVSCYSDNIISNRFLPLSTHNLLYIIDIVRCQISSIKELDIIEYFKIYNDDTLWTIESLGGNIYNNILFLREYKINIETHELIKIGERKIFKTHFITDNIAFINNKKIMLSLYGKQFLMFK